MPKLFEEHTPKTIWEKTNLILHNSKDERLSNHLWCYIFCERLHWYIPAEWIQMPKFQWKNWWHYWQLAALLGNSIGKTLLLQDPFIGPHPSLKQQWKSHLFASDGRCTAILVHQKCMLGGVYQKLQPISSPKRWISYTNYKITWWQSGKEKHWCIKKNITFTTKNCLTFTKIHSINQLMIKNWSGVWVGAGFFQSGNPRCFLIPGMNPTRVFSYRHLHRATRRSWPLGRNHGRPSLKLT